ncbi:hypothetical protein [Adlercreutzia sp. ZJ141]|uniref:hypothetical protein n=1 Tax=Adlercreutzia sp. ZJ141 TaxID=2709406 RepID=UPI0013ECE9F3|nr:hypothetical protein [Adlercreutzia sp. ZJ141]
MASDFGDEAGEKLFDWMLRIGQDAGEKAMTVSVKKFKEALRNARVKAKTPERTGDDWAKLNMAEFKDLPEYDAIKDILSDKLKADGVEHDFYEDNACESWLLFRVIDAQDVSRAFEELEGQADRALEKAKASPEMEKARQEHLGSPATDKQIAYLDSLVGQGKVPGDEYETARKGGLTIAAANGLLNKYANNYLKLRDDEPLEERADRAREGSKAMAAKGAVDKEISLAEVRAK